MDARAARRRQGATAAGAGARAAALGLAGAGTAGAAAALLGVGTGDQLAATGPRAPLAEVVPVVATGAGALVTGWLAVVLLLGAVAALPRRPGAAGVLPTLARRCAPRLAPRVAAALTGAALAAAGPAPAQAVPTALTAAAAVPTASAIPVPWLDQPGECASSRAGDDSTSLPRPDLGRTPAAAREGTAGPADGHVPAARRPGTIEVSPGDTLWDLVAAHLPSGATDADVADAWPRWYAANRDVIGPDPDLLLPGQRLRVPATVAGTTGADR